MTDSTRYNIWRWRFMYCWIIVFTVITFSGLYDNRHQTTDIRDQANHIQLQAASNRQLTKDIQASRLSACKQTYKGIRKVFKPFFPPAKNRTAKQDKDLNKFNKIIDDLIVGCSQQVKPK